MTTLFNASSSNKANPFRVQDFQFRFRKLQILCQKLDLNGILILTGHDSLNNEEYDRLVSWLFNGNAGNAVDDEIYIEDGYKEFIFMIYKDGAYCYAESPLFEKIEKYLLAIPNIKIYSPTKHDLENTDVLELTKITQFYKMTRDLSSVGVCLGAKDENKISNIEKWPLLQAYALDGTLVQYFFLILRCWMRFLWNESQCKRHNSRNSSTLR
jgi:hypothetical protein